MKNFKQIFKTTISIVLLGMTTTAFAQVSDMASVIRIGSGSGGKIGSGAGGRAQFISTENMSGDVVVPYPGIVPNPNSLIVIGEPGPNQNNEIGIRFCTDDGMGKPLLKSCHMQFKATLNQPIDIPSELVYIEYSNSFIFVKKEQGVPLVINLRKISVPKAKEDVIFKVFVDYSDPQEVLKIGLGIWGVFDSEGVFLTALCSHVNEFCGTIRNSINNNDISSFINTIVKTNYKGEVSFLNSTGKYSPYEKTWVVDPRDGEFVSVLPGVYGIVWVNSKGQVSTTYGIKVD